MIQSTFAVKYQKLAKQYGANLVPSLYSALKKLDAERDPAKVQGLTKPAIDGLKKAIADLDELARMSNDKVKEAAKKLAAGLKDLMTKIEKFGKDGSKEAAEEPSEEDIKDAKAVGVTLATLDKGLHHTLDEYGKLRSKTWQEILAFGEKRWKCIRSFAKSYGASTQGFRGFPMAIDMMVEECGKGDAENAKPLKGGAKQTILVQDEKADDNSKNIKQEFINFSKGEVKAELSAVKKSLKELSRLIDTGKEQTKKVGPLSEKLLKEVKELGASPQGLKVVNECSKLKGSAAQVSKALEKADEKVNLLIKIVTDKDGLGKEDGDLRDGFDEIPDIDKVGDTFHASVKNIEAAIKAL